ncbi:MAG: hypothetical protein CMA59_00905 [Euryarchaeota archaeon]|nr:hypothetical protein [Euryarchaeota archaeon]
MFNYVGPAKPLREVSSRTLEQGRFYKIDDVWMPSVTTVVGHQSKAGILKWQERVGFTKAEQIRRSSAWRGTQYHNLVENYLKNDVEEVEKGEGLPTYLFRAARQTLDRINNIHAIEAPLFSHNLRIAGRVDCIAEFDNELAIIDFKTTKSLKKPEHLEKFFVQEAAYAYMYYELTGVEVDKLVTLSVAEDGSVQVEQKYDKIPYIDTLIDWISEYHDGVKDAA